LLADWHTGLLDLSHFYAISDQTIYIGDYTLAFWIFYVEFLYLQAIDEHFSVSNWTVIHQSTIAEFGNRFNSARLFRPTAQCRSRIFV
jgi:hypothetical protein